MNTEKCATIFATTRYKVGISQETMANELGVSRRTVQNWESGVSQPSVLQTANWFRILGLNPTPYFLHFSFEEFEDLYGPTYSDDDVNNALTALLDHMDMKQKRSLLYLYYGSHGSDPESVVQLMLANLHTPMKNRVAIAASILNNYEIAECLDELLDTDHIMPDVELLRTAIDQGKIAAMRGHNAYSI